jgi:hypothetical protein
MDKPFPIIEYAHKIGKNTSELTATDMIKFTKWWIKQPIRDDIVSMKVKVTPEQNIVYNQDKAKVLEHYKKFPNEAQKIQNMLLGKIQKEPQIMKKYASEQDFIAAQDFIETTVQQNEMEHEQEIIVELGLTKTDVESLLWVISEIYENYELAGTMYDASLKNLQEGLQEYVS